MKNYKQRLPQLDGNIFLTDGGIETHMMYKRDYKLKHFCLFDLLNNPVATRAIREYHERIIEVALNHQVGMILDGALYRASRDWGDLLGYSPEGLAEIVTRGIEFYKDLAGEYATDTCQMPVSGNIGPRGDAYDIGHIMEVDEAEDYHTEQIATMKAAGADFVSAQTFSQVNEVIGLVRAAVAQEIPAVISFTLDGTANLNTGPTLGEAITAVDAATDSAPAYYMVNCTHPIDYIPAFEAPGDWIMRLRGIRPNASSLDKGMLCQLGHLEEGDPVELGGQMADMARRFPHMNVWGGCCGTDYNHIDEMVKAILQVRASEKVLETAQA